MKLAVDAYTMIFAMNAGFSLSQVRQMVGRAVAHSAKAKEVITLTSLVKQLRTSSYI